jgi:hypothetical protein
MRTSTVSIVFLAILTSACGRSNAALDPETQAQLDQATTDAETALAASESNATDIAAIDSRVDTLEENANTSDPALRADLNAVAADVDVLEGSINGLTLRITQVESALPVRDHAVQIDDKSAAGFPDVAPVTNVEQGLSYINQRLDLQAQAVSGVETTQSAQATTMTALEARIVALEAFQAEGLSAAIQAALDARVAPLEANVSALDARVDDVSAATRPYVLGLSLASSSGRFEYNGETGVRAATAMCRATFVDDTYAHICSPDETHRAVALGNHGDPAGFDDTYAWTVSGMTRQHASENAFTDADSLVTSCNNLLTDADDVASGTRLKVVLAMPSFGTGGADIAGDAVIVQPNRSCAETYPVLCCR